MAEQRDAAVELIAIGMDLDLPFLLRDIGLRLAGYISDKPFKCREAHLGSFEKLPELLSRKNVVFLLAAYEPRVKMLGAQEIQKNGGTIRSVISPDAKIASTATIGLGSIVQHGVYIGDDAFIGRGVKVNVNTSIHHGSSIGDYSTISPHCAILGDCTVGTGVIIGAGSTLRNDVTVGDNTYIGMGAAVVKDVAAGSISYGVPAKRVGDFKIRS